MGGEVVLACLVPHPPIMVYEVGGEESRKVSRTARAMEELAKRLAACNPQTLVFITPHGPLARDTVFVGGMSEITGSLAAFGAPSVAFGHPVDQELAEEIKNCAARAGYRVETVSRWVSLRHTASELDHGVVVPLYYLRQHLPGVPLVLLSYALWPLKDLFAFGRRLREAIEAANRRAAVVASGDLSHRLLPGAPAGYDPRGEELDRRLKDLLDRMDVKGILELPEDLIEAAGECGLRSLVVALGALEGLNARAKILSYEGPFGVGYMVAVMEPEGGGAKGQQARAEESVYVRLARESLETYVREGRRIEPPRPVPEELKRPAGAFVSLKKHGRLRGCIGTIRATQPTLAEEIIANAISAGTRDPRFDPVRPEELGELTYSVDVLEEPEPVRSLDELDPKRYGVIVRKGWRSGLLLPDIEGIDTVEEQIRIAKQKAGIGPDEDCEIQRFKVKRYY